MSYKTWLSGFLLTLTSLAPLSFAADELSIRQRIILPGPVAEAHADLEATCENCHASFDDQALTQLCLDCHEEIDEDLNTKSGFHGQNLAASSSSCETCHTDHEGRDADIVGYLPESFNHFFTRFPLEGAHLSLACTACHESDKKYRETESSCFSCHEKDDVHQEKLGKQCEDCHQTESWHEVLPFDHDDTQFPLEGKHTKVQCNACHFGQKYTFTETTCFSCHAIADVHEGDLGNKCEDCHTVKGWDTVKFDHDETGFPLKGKHEDLPCSACHLEGVEYEDTPDTCVGCHADTDIHLGRYGKQCEDCHNTQDWQTSLFKHNRDTDYPLTGEHVGLACVQCHKGSIYDNLGRDCASCHAGDNPHRDENMSLCGTCHNTKGWNIINQFDHDFHEFALIGMHRIVTCESCHIGNQFAGTGQKCIDCHKMEDVHEGAFGTNCNSCHTPNAWNIWSFDHEQDTGYALEGKHSNLACESCHEAGSEPAHTPTICGACHIADDIHKGEFGQHCDRCHGTSNFFDLLFRDE